MDCRSPPRPMERHCRFELDALLWLAWHSVIRIIMESLESMMSVPSGRSHSSRRCEPSRARLHRGREADARMQARQRHATLALRRMWTSCCLGGMQPSNSAVMTMAARARRTDLEKPRDFFAALQICTYLDWTSLC